MVKIPDVGEGCAKTWISRMLPVGRKNGRVTVDHRLAVSLKTKHVTAIELNEGKGSNYHLLHRQVDSLLLSHQGSPLLPWKVITILLTYNP